MSDSVPVEQFTLPISAQTGYLLIVVLGMAIVSCLIYVALLNVRPERQEFSKKTLIKFGISIVAVLWGIVFLVFADVCFDIIKQMRTSPDAPKYDGRTISAFFAAVAALVAAPLLIWRSYNVHRQTNTAEQGQITDRFTKAVEQIGAVKAVKRDGEDQTLPNLEVRIGGLHALERVANNSPDDRESIINILCPYVRHNLNDHRASVDLQGKAGEIDLREDIGLALGIISRLATIERKSNNSFLAPLQGSDFRCIGMRNINFTYMDLTLSFFPYSKQDKVSYHGCNLTTCGFSHSSLKNVKFTESQLERSIFQDTYLFASRFSNTPMYLCNFKGSGFYFCSVDAASLDATRLKNAFFDTSNAFSKHPSLAKVKPCPSGWLIDDDNPTFKNYRDFEAAWHQWREENSFPKL